MRGLGLWVFLMGLWAGLGISGLSSSVQAMPQSKLHYEAVDALLSPHYFVFLGKHLPTSAYGRLSVDYEKNTSEVSFYYKINPREHLSISSKKTSYLRPCNRTEVRTFFNHPQLGKLFICTQQNATNHDKDSSSFMSLQPKAGLYLLGEYTGPLQNLSTYLNQTSLYMTSASVVSHPFSRQRHINFYRWLYPQEQHDLFGEIGLPLQRVGIFWSGSNYPGMEYTFSGFSPGSRHQNSSSASYYRRRSYIHFNYHSSSHVMPCRTSEIALNFAYYPYNYALCITSLASPTEQNRHGQYKPFTQATLKALVKTSPTNSISFNMPHDDFRRALQILRDKHALY